MSAMEGMRGYQSFNALKLHFTGDYDYFKYHGKIKSISEEKLANRKDHFHFRKLERKYKDELENFIVANLMTNTVKWVGDLITIKAEKNYAEWKNKQTQLMELIKEDLKKLPGPASENWDIVGNNHPPILRMYLGNKIMIETLIATNEVLGFIPIWNKKISETVIWPDVSRLMQKYRPFLQLNKNEIRQLMKEVLL